MAKNDDANLDARRALLDALASAPPGARRATAGPARVRRPSVPDAPTATPADPTGEDDTVIKQITVLGSFLANRLEDVDHRLDELADLLESLLSSLLEFLLASLPEGNDHRHEVDNDPGVPANGDALRTSADSV